MSDVEYAVCKETAWCPGCGNFGIVQALAGALQGLGIPKHQVLFVSGIGQAGKLPHYIEGNVLNTLHGRTLPTATGAKLANSKLKVIAVGGDGDGYAEGGNHFLHATRKNIDITYIVHDNRVFGLTKGQASPMSESGMVTGTTPSGSYHESFNPLAVAITNNAGFVARSYSANHAHLVATIQAAIQHPGFSLVDVLQPCVTFNKRNTYQWYRSRVYDLGETDYDSSDRNGAWQKSWEWGDRIPLGVFYTIKRPTLADHLPTISQTPLVEQPIQPGQFTALLDRFRV